MMSYKLCGTRTGLVGTVTLDTVVGDAVCVFMGGSLPFMLRPSAGLQRKYQVVGGCYIHGMVSGGFVRSGRWREEDVTLR
jgi:hypothetical protein